jgi:S-adenosylmethionine-diacylglycerol 3-amino-3-carboxypropyl transferase
MGSDRLDPGRAGSLRYGQCWEDADRLIEALGPIEGRTVLSIASGGENSLALLAEGPARLIVLDHNPAQIALLELKLAAIAALGHGELMLLLGAWATAGLDPAELIQRRLGLYQRCRDRLSAAAAAFWDRHPALIGGGLLRAGRFERYLERFRRWLLPLVQGEQAWQPLLEGLSREQRRAWYAEHWDGWRWRLLFRLAFCRTALGHLGTDPSHVRYGRGSQTELLLERLHHVIVALDPTDNPYLHWLLRGHFDQRLPRALDPERVAHIRRHLERIELHPLSLADYLERQGPGAGWIERFNLSNVFDYQSPEATSALLARLHRHAASGARLVGWNRLADRDGRLAPAGTWSFDRERAEALHRRDRVFFYKRLLVAEALGSPSSRDAPPPRLRRIAPPPGLWPADECWRLESGGRERARAAIWWQHTPPLPGERVGAIGSLSASDAAAAQLLLRHACRRLAEQGCTRVLAPMDGNTWNAYRCRTGAALGFPGEPEPGPEWIAHLHACGFEVETHYLSQHCGRLQWRRAAAHSRRRLDAVRIEDLASLQRQGGAAALAGQIHRLVHAGFRHQPYFLPLAEAVFRRRFEAQPALADPVYTLLALAGEQLLGLLIAHRSGSTLVVRTLVVQPGRCQAGLGTRLLEEAHARAALQGCRGAIHALMHAGGASLPLSRHYADASPAGGYVLMGRRLAAVAGVERRCPSHSVEPEGVTLSHAAFSR